MGVADPGDDVLALGIHEEVAVGAGGAGGGIPRKTHPSSRVVVPISEDHRLHVDGGAEIVRDALAHAVGNSAGAVPGAEHGLNGATELVHRRFRERCPGVLLDDALELVHEGFQGLGRYVGVCGGATRLLGLLEGFVEGGARHPEDDAAVHLDKASVGVKGEPLIAGLSRQALDGGVVKTEVEDGVHHPGHRELGAGPDRHEQRLGGVAEPAAHLLLEAGEVLCHLVGELGRPAGVHVGAAGVGGDREAVRHGECEHRRHLGQVGALAAEEILHLHGRSRVLVVEVEDVGHLVRFLLRGDADVPAVTKGARPSLNHCAEGSRRSRAASDPSSASAVATAARRLSGRASAWTICSRFVVRVSAT